MTQQEVIKTFMQSLNDTTLKGGKALDAAIKTASGSKFKSFAALKKKFLTDQKAAKNWHTFLVEKCGIILDNADTGAISGSDAGGSKTKKGTDILPSTGEAKYPEGSSFTVDGLTIYGIPNKRFLTADQQYVIQGLYSWWIRDALALIKESYGFSFTDVDTTNSRLKMKFVDDPDDSSYAYVTYQDIDEKEKIYESRKLCVNIAKFRNMSPDNRHGSTSEFALDRVLVHELVHGIMASNINYFGNLPDFFTEGGSAELIHGLDDENYDDIVEYAKDPSALEEVLTTKLLEDPPDAIYEGGYIFMRYFAKQAADTTFDYDKYRKTVSVKNNFATNYWDTVTMKGGKGSDTITNSGNNVSIGAAAGNDTIKNYGDTVKINAGDGKDYVLNEGLTVTIVGGKGDDSVKNSGDSVKISGDAGADAVYNTGNEVSIVGGANNDFITNSISDYETIDTLTEEEEVFTYNGASLKSDGDYYVVDLIGGNNATLAGGDGNDTIYNYGYEVLIKGDAGKNLINNFGADATIYGGSDSDTVINGISELNIQGNNVSVTGYKSKIFVGDGDDSIYNKADCAELNGEDGADTFTNYGWGVSINGGSGADSVENYGDYAYISLGAGNDEVINYADFCSLAGDAGNDEIINYADFCSLAGDAGNDNLFNFGEESTLNGGEGVDEIENYGDENSLAGGSGDDYIYSSGEQSTLNGGADKDILYNEGVYAYLIGGKGNDTLYNEGDHVTLSGGAGNDEIVNTGKHIEYEFGKSDGKDTVYGFNDGDTIKITSGTYKTKKIGSNVIVTVGNSTLTLQNAVNKKINFTDSKGKTTSKTYSAKVKAKVANDWISADDKNFITSGAQLSSIVNSGKASYYGGNLNSLSDSTSLTQKNNLIAYGGKK